jgi:predicted nucleotidyltransferase
LYGNRAGTRRQSRTRTSSRSGALSRHRRKVIAAGLFGSFARGAARAGSDIDLFVVVQTLKEKERISRMLSDAQLELTRRYGWPVQAVIFERRRLIRGLEKAQTLLDEAAADWQHVAGLMPRELRKSLRPLRAPRQHS